MLKCTNCEKRISIPVNQCCKNDLCEALFGKCLATIEDALVQASAIKKRVEPYDVDSIFQLLDMYESDLANAEERLQQRVDLTNALNASIATLKAEHAEALFQQELELANAHCFELMAKDAIIRGLSKTVLAAALDSEPSTDSADVMSVLRCDV